MIEYYKNKYRIPTMRLKDWDYSTPGMYFVTICCKNRKSVLAEIENNKVILSKQGIIAITCWKDLAIRYSDCSLDRYVIMPNHIHGIITVHNKNTSVETIHELSLQKEMNNNRRKMLLPKIIGYFKMQSSKQINIFQKTQGKPFWQSGFYDHIIRNDEDLNRIREYIENNPLKWELDKYYMN